MASWLNKVWSGLDFWDKQENKSQRQQFAREDKKKREEEPIQRQPNLSVSNDVPADAVTKRPQNLFGTLNDTNKQSQFGTIDQLTAPKPQIASAQRPAPQVVDRIARPEQSLSNKFRDIFDANTEADQYRRAVRIASENRQNTTPRATETQEQAFDRAARQAKISAATPHRSIIDDTRDAQVSMVRGAGTVVPAIGRVIGGVAEGNSDLAGFGGTLINAPIQYLRHGTVEGSSDNLIANQFKTFNRPVKAVNRFMDRSAEAIGGEQNMPAYRYSQGALELLAAVATLGGTAGMQAASKSSKAARIAETTPSLLKARQAAEAEQAAELAKAAKWTKIADQLSFSDNTLGKVGNFIDNLVNNPVKSLTNRLRNIGATDGVAEVGNLTNKVENVLSDAQLDDIMRTDIPVGKGIDVAEEGVEDVVAVRNANRDKNLIKEVAGDAETPNLGEERLNQIRKARREPEIDVSQSGLPDVRVEGFKKPSLVDDITQSEINTERKALDDALANGELNKIQHKEAVKALEENTVIDRAPTPDGTPISVKEVRDIPVEGATNAPQNLPETPGTVRATTATTPEKELSEIVARQPHPIPIEKPLKVGEVDSQGRIITKRMVDSQRNQRKLAKKYAKAQEETAEILGSIEGKKPVYIGDRQENLAATGKFAKGKYGNVYEVRNRETGMEGAREATQNTSMKDFLAENGNKDWDNDTSLKAQALLERNPSKQDEDLYRAIARKNIEQGTREGGDLALRAKVIRRTESPEKLTNSFVRKLYGNSTEGSISKSQIKQITKVNQAFTDSRDDVNRLIELSKSQPSSANAKAVDDMARAMEKTDRVARVNELKVAREVLKNDKSKEAAKFLRKLEEDVDIALFDFTNANNLSSTGVMERNAINNLLVAAERQKLSGKYLKGALSGFKHGLAEWKLDNKLRADILPGKFNPVNLSKRWSSAGNTLGDTFLKATAEGETLAHYKDKLEKAGYTGEELVNRAKVLATEDRLGLTEGGDDVYQRSFMEQLQQAALAGMTHGGKARGKLENDLAEYISGNLDNVPAVRSLSKGIVNTLLGYPTVVTRSALRGVDRATLGLPNLIKSGLGRLTKNTEYAAKELSQAGRNLKSGAISSAIGTALYNSGNMTLGYPSDPDARARWKDERKSEYSIKIGDSWYPIPSTLGPFAIPFLAVPTAIDAISKGGDIGDISKSLGKMIIDSSTPVDDILSISKALNGEQTGNWFAQKAAMLASSQTPFGGLLRQVAKMLDGTVRTTDESASLIKQTTQNFIKGLPGMSMTLPEKLDSQGEPFKHPNAVETVLGASTKEHQPGVERSQESDQQIQDKVSQIDKYGLLNDPNMEGVLKDTGLEAYKKLKSGRALDESDIKSLRAGLVKSVSASSDTAYLERGQYDTNLAVLKLKRDLMEEDKTTAPSKLKSIEDDIKRGEVYKNNQIPYDMIAKYKNNGEGISVTEWRELADTDPELYQKLWDLDVLMAKNGVSNNTNNSSEQKYSQKGSKGRGRGGSGGRGSNKISTDFGQLKSGGQFAPKVRGYETLAEASGNVRVPVIRRTMPNIVHRIGTRGYN